MKKVFVCSLAVCLLLSAAAWNPPIAVAADTSSPSEGWDISWEAGVSTITWAAVDGAAYYDISHNGAHLGVFTPVGMVRADEPLTFSYASANPKYANYFKVTAKNGGVTVGEQLISLERKIFGDNCYFYDSAYHTAADALAEINPIGLAMGSLPLATSEKSPNRYAMFFKPGNYVSNTHTLIGFFTGFYGLGRLPAEVALSGVRCQSQFGSCNACTFYRSIENVEVRNYAGGTDQYSGFNWCVSQGAPARRVSSVAQCCMAFGGPGPNDWSSPGYFADCVFQAGFANVPSQQLYTRNCSLTGAYTGVFWNTFIHGCTGSFPADSGSGWSEGNHVTNLPSVEKIREKPFLYLDGGEYKVFVPDWRTDASGVSWGSGKANGGMGPGESLDLLENFHIAFPGDTAASINAALAQGKNLLLTPGIYMLEKPIHVTRPGAIVLALGYASLVPDEGNQWGAMLVEDVGGVIVTGLYFETFYSSVYLLRVGETGCRADHSDNPIFLQDLNFEIGGTLMKHVQVDAACQINSSDVICDHFWMEREDHGVAPNGGMSYNDGPGYSVGWTINETDYGLIVSGDRVTCNALFNEAFQKYTAYWEGDYGKVFFYQNETPYDPTSQAAWMSHEGAINGYAQYKVASKVDHHMGIGLGVYGCLSRANNVYAVNAYEVPIKSGVTLDHICMQNYGNPGTHFRYLINQWSTTANYGNNAFYLNHYPPSNLANAGIQPVDAPDDPDFIIPDYGSRSLSRPLPGVTVTGQFRSYNPNGCASVQLLRDGGMTYSADIAYKAGYGQTTQDFTFKNVEPGDYTLVITKDAHTTFTVQKVTVGDGGLDLTQDNRFSGGVMTLLCGDINGDGMINDSDLAELWKAANYNKSASDPGVNKLCDLNGDGMINDSDLAILWAAANYNKGAVLVVP